MGADMRALNWLLPAASIGNKISCNKKTCHDCPVTFPVDHILSYRVHITVVNREGEEVPVRGKIGDNLLYLCHRHGIEMEGINNKKRGGHSKKKTSMCILDVLTFCAPQGHARRH